MFVSLSNNLNCLQPVFGSCHTYQELDGNIHRDIKTHLCLYKPLGLMISFWKHAIGAVNIHANERIKEEASKAFNQPHIHTY